MLRVVLLVIVVFFFLTVLRGLRIFFAAVRNRPAGGTARSGGTREGEMVRDPVCGRWIDQRLAIAAQSGGQTVPVCSDECGQKLRAAP